MIAAYLGLFGVQWERPWALWCTPLLAIAWWLLVAARRPRPIFTGSFSLWPKGDKLESSHRNRGFLPARFWELAALACGLLALAGPLPLESHTLRPMQVVVDRTASMYLSHGESGGPTRLALARRVLDQWQDSRPRVSLQYLDVGAVAREPLSTWLVGWEEAPEVPRPELDWAHWDRPGVVWLTDRWPATEPLHASVIAVGGDFQPGPVAWMRGGVLSDTGSGALLFEERAAPRVVGGSDWPEPWKEFVSLWSDDRGYRWEPDQTLAPGDALRLTVPGSEAAEGQPFDLRGGGYRLQGTCLLAPPESADWVQGPWRVTLSVGEQALIFSGPGAVQLNVAQWQAVEGDLGAFAVDLARFLDSACLLPAGIVSQGERAAAEPGQIRRGLWVASEEIVEVNSSTWSAWLAIAAMLCLLAGLGVGWTRGRVAR